MIQDKPSMDEVVRQAKEAVTALYVHGYTISSDAVRLLIEEREQYKAEIERLTRNMEEIAKENRIWRDRNQSLKEIVEVVNMKEHTSEIINTQYWAWMPDDDNHLESLVCPVLIPADWLRQLLEEARAEQDKEIQRLKWRCALLEEQEEPRIRFKMDENGNLTKIEDF